MALKPNNTAHPPDSLSNSGTGRQFIDFGLGALPQAHTPRRLPIDRPAPRKFVTPLIATLEADLKAVIQAVAAKHQVQLGMGDIKFDDKTLALIVSGAVKDASLPDTGNQFVGLVNLPGKPPEGQEDAQLAPIEPGDEKRKANPDTPLTEWMMTILKDRKLSDDYRTVAGDRTLRIYGYSSRNPKNKWLLMSPDGTKFKAPWEFVSKYFGY